MKAIIFDLDGVLVSTDKFHYLAWKEIADQEGIEFNEEINHLLRGVSRMESLEIILRKAKKIYNAEEKLNLATAKNEIYKKYLMTMNKNDVDVSTINTLKILIQRGYQLAIGSSSKNAETILNITDIREFFTVIADGNQIKESKPNPEVFLLAAKKLGIEPCEAYVIEDAQSGIDAANEGGFISIGINEASHYNKSKYKIKDLKELLTIVKPING